MANSSVFRSIVGALLPIARARNAEGAPAYEMLPRHALAQYAATGCLNRTFYASAEEQLAQVLELCNRVTPEFIARTAIYCRERGHMKDMPALLLAMLARRDAVLMEAAFDRVVDTPRMLRTFVQIVRSGVTGRKSLGSAPKRCVRRWLDVRGDDALFFASVGNTPSLADIVKMVHPRPASPTREALYGYITGRPVAPEALPPSVRQFEAFKVNPQADLPDVPFQLLTSLDIGRRGWAVVARRASWQTLRMNLNTLARHGVFEEPEMTTLVANRLRDGAEIERARVFPYQLLAAFQAADTGVPAAVRMALEEAMEQAIANVPCLEGRVFVCPDVSGSMLSSLTGERRGATTRTRCIDVAALMAAAVLRRNPGAEVLPFADAVRPASVSARHSVMTNAAQLSALGGGGTSVSAPLARLNARQAAGDLVVIVSDNESWVDARPGRATATLEEWARFRARNPRARLVLIDLQPAATTQAVEREDILNVGGFSDQVFELVADFAAGRLQNGHWVDRIDAVAL